MSPILNDSVRFRFPNLATISNDTIDLAFPSKRNTMDTLLAFATIDVPAHLRVLGGSDREFSGVLDAIRAELAPSGLVEALMVDQVVLAVARLRAIVLGGDEPETTAALLSRAEQSLHRALNALAASRKAAPEGWGHAAEIDTRVGDVDSMPLPPDAVEPAVVEATPMATVAAPVEGHWRDRLIFDENVSEESPVVRGTWVTAGQVISLIVDGQSRDDILRSYPELTERDVRACLAYTVEQDGPISL